MTLSPPPTPAPDPAELYDRYGRQVYAWAYRLLGRHHDALDVAQDVFVRWVKHAGAAAPQHPQAWLRRVTINRAIDVARARRDSQGSGPTAAAAVTGELELDELRTAVAAALADLSDQQRAVLVAKVYDGLTFARIAEQLELAVPTVKTHYLRALAAVRDRLAPRWGDDEHSKGPLS